MNNFIVIVAAILCAAAIGVSIWSMITVRKRYYNDYLCRKGKNRD
jgi:hypothetical protein